MHTYYKYTKHRTALCMWVLNETWHFKRHVMTSVNILITKNVNVQPKHLVLANLCQKCTSKICNPKVLFLRKNNVAIGHLKDAISS